LENSNIVRSNIHFRPAKIGRAALTSYLDRPEESSARNLDRTRILDHSIVILARRFWIGYYWPWAVQYVLQDRRIVMSTPADKMTTPGDVAREWASSRGASPICGFIGLGNMGRPMAGRIAAAGLHLMLWARRPASLDDLLGETVVSCTSPRALGEACDVVGLCVRTDEEVLDVVLREPDGLLGGMRPGSVLLIHATVLPQTIEALYKTARDRGVHLLDAPVSGGAKGAMAGTLTVLLGGDAEAVALVQPVIRTFGRNFPHVGGPGTAQLLKLINNNLTYANVAMSIDALEVATALGVDPKTAATVISISSGASHGLDLIMDRSSMEKMTGATSNVRKDVAHLVEVLEARGGRMTILTDISQTTADRVIAYTASDISAA
jgi:3-hydroxyisobutyrate dehydrogenase